MVAVAGVLMLGAVVQAHECQAIATLVERLRPRPVEIHATHDLVPVRFDDILKAAHVVVEGEAQHLRTYMTDDGCELRTDYAVTVDAVIAGTLPSRGASGPAKTLVVTVRGGETYIAGVKVLDRQHHAPELPENERLILFLAGQPGRDGYVIATELYGAYNVAGESVRCVFGDAPPADSPVRRADFVSRVEQVLGRKTAPNDYR